ncbi:cysteine-rich receptor-like protein kinase 10 [Silene latifolia]|uniref:cysteine-rich receptor-like protein kinase 10 n=1 Tax=Silene latifolia TaxID=37657 RepID=UPI003D771DA1
MKGAIVWYDGCQVRYTNSSFYMDNLPGWIAWHASDIIGDKIQYMDAVTNMINVIALQAAGGGSFKKFATDFVNYSASQPIYGLGQCTPILIGNDCYGCLNSLIQYFHQKPGGQVLAPSCIVRFEAFPFFNLSYLPQVHPPSPSPSPLPSSGKNKTSTNKAIAIAVVLTLLGAGSFAITFYFIIRRCKSKKIDDDTHETEDLITRESLLYTMATLETATNGFSNENKLGQGGFGSVYKGTLPNGEEVAVKRLSKSSHQGAQEFKNEILLVAKLQHKNLSRLLGFALNQKEKLLVYEYVPNKSLDNFVFDPAKQGQLKWRLRYKIIQGIAKGMLYLHQDSGLKIIHRDLKASNILLDAKMNPKIADFGLARMFDYDKSQSNTSRVVGTYGYMSPEYVTRGIYSTKSDVYSYGILILEIISGKINSAFPEESYGESLVIYAWKLWHEGKSLEFVDASIRDSCSSNEVTRCVHLGLLCVQKAVESRPTMATVVLTLESNIRSLPVPSEPGFFNKDIGDSDLGNDIVIVHSSNHVSMSEIEPR